MNWTHQKLIKCLRGYHSWIKTRRVFRFFIVCVFLLFTGLNEALGHSSTFRGRHLGPSSQCRKIFFPRHIICKWCYECKVPWRNPSAWENTLEHGCWSWRVEVERWTFNPSRFGHVQFGHATLSRAPMNSTGPRNPYRSAQWKHPFVQAKIYSESLPEISFLPSLSRWILFSAYGYTTRSCSFTWRRPQEIGSRILVIVTGSQLMAASVLKYFSCALSYRGAWFCPRPPA